MKGKNKLVPRLLGITKESVMRVDEKTKEVIQEWNLTNIKRWAASPKSFTLVSWPWKCSEIGHWSTADYQHLTSDSFPVTLHNCSNLISVTWFTNKDVIFWSEDLLCFQDFGDYQDGYYSVQTTEGEQIAQLIAGYIDIILKKVTAMEWNCPHEAFFFY